MRDRGWVAIAGLGCVLLCTWGAIAFLCETPGDATRDGEAAARATHRATLRADAKRDGEGGADAARDGDDSASKLDLTPTVVAVEPRLDWPDVANLRRIEQRGRTLFGGIVFAPDGSPCPGATIWCGEKVIATSDDHGAWRADVPRPFNGEYDALPRFFSGVESPNSDQLAARKAGVGYAHAELGSISRRIDLHLERGFTFSGMVVDNDTLNPVAGAELDASVGWFHERVKADALGKFAFPNLPGGNLDLAGRAPGYDSNGTFPYNFDRGRDVEITFRLTRAYRLRGEFAPWPAPGIATSGAVVSLVPRSPHGTKEGAAIRGDVGADGAFDLPLPVCPTGRVEFAVDGSALWQTEVDVNEEKHDVDLGRIELTAAPATLTGRVAVDDAKLVARIEVGASESIEGAPPVLIWTRVAADGTFRLTPLAPGYANLMVQCDGVPISGTAQAAGLTASERDFGAGVLLAASETRDVGVIAPRGEFFHGTVKDARGEPIALARVSDLFPMPAGTPRPRFATIEMATTDEDGRFACSFMNFREKTPARTVVVSARGFAPRRFEVDCPEGAHWIRRDFVLDDGCLLHGTLVDESGAPLCGWSIRVEPADAADDRPDDRAALDTTQADGSFAIRGLAAGEFTLYAHPRGGATVKFTKIHPEQGELALCTRDATPDTTSK